MSDEHRDERMDELLREAARDYNRPPGTPRDLMWERIEARRRGLGPRPSALGPRPDVAPGVIPLRHRAQPHWVRWAVGIAAGLLLGFGIGRWGRPERSAPVSSVAVNPKPTGITPSDSNTSSESSPAKQGVASVPSSAETTSTQLRPPREQRVAQGDAPNEPRRTLGEEHGAGAEGRGPRAEGREASPAYTLAAIQHLTQAEALLTSFRAEARSGKQVDAQLSTWARDLLVSTRLMLDSPAARDPRMRRLLEDLELVLAQIAQVGAQRSGEELNLIDEAVEGRNVLPRLRTTIPAGTRPVGS